MYLGGAKDEHFSCFLISCQLGLKQQQHRRQRDLVLNSCPIHEPLQWSMPYPMERELHTWKQSSLVLTTVTVVLLCFMETPKIILLTEAIISKWTCIRCLRLFRVVEVGLRGFPLVSTTVLGIRVFVINSDRNLSIECSVSGSIFDRFVRT